MPDIIIPDTSCLIFLDKIGELEILQKLYQKTVVTNEIAEEYMLPLKKWIKIESANKKLYQKILEQSVDKGEASILVLALEMENCIVSIDDLKARKTAKKLGLRLTGTLGILYKAKKAGYIQSMNKTIDKLKDADFRISEKIEKELLRLSGEL
jgi:predicted nucleic acid-binding protein